MALTNVTLTSGRTVAISDLRLTTRLCRRPLHGVWVDGGRDGSGESGGPER
ncbi:hypothetical protein [Streptomyces mirabilis]|uniref:hypothetical protein n=1 Tax=Streptomyces mirabilis TaxID=68239 RepID=UPI003698BEF6